MKAYYINKFEYASILLIEALGEYTSKERIQLLGTAVNNNSKTIFVRISAQQKANASDREIVNYIKGKLTEFIKTVGYEK